MENIDLFMFRRIFYPDKNIVLTGFMGTGKSTVARELAFLTGMKVISTDRNIELKSGTSIANIFSSRGEEKFRELECSEIKSLTGISGSIIDCGGGVVLNPENIKILREISFLVWLRAGVETILRRIEGDFSRPLLNVQNKIDVIKETLRIRTPLYENAAHVIIDTDNKSPAEIALLIIKKIPG